MNLYLLGHISFSTLHTKAYANGAAHKAVLAKGIACPYAKTGVKYCHHKAVEYDIGIYYEANGHGTAIFKDEIVDMIRQRKAGNNITERQNLAMERLLATAQLYNQAVGDATCDALFVECVLAIKGWDVFQWDAIYQGKMVFTFSTRYLSFWYCDE